jgi:oxalate decarboxylase/phosphoglucose isomerase-like protein (cupin superfamily)
MSTTAKTGNMQQLAADKKFLVDPYLDWANGEGIPIHEDFGFDLLALETAPWDRYEARGCFAHAVGRGDFMSCYVLEIPAGGKTRPVKHLYEAFFFTLSGHGSTVVWTPDGQKRTFEWGPKAVFAIPLNCTYQIFNGSGREPARVSCTNDAPLTINLYHNLKFVFENDFTFEERSGDSKHFDGEGNFIPVKPGSHMWETNFVPDLTNFKLEELEDRGKGSRNIAFILAEGTMHAHSSEIPTGRYKKAHRHAAGTHVHAVTGEGYSLLWYEGDSEFKEIPWRHGIMYVPPFWMLHQHFNTCPEPARYLACSLGSRRYPFIALRRRGAEGAAQTSMSKGGRQIDYEEQDPRVHHKWLSEIDKNGVKSDMSDIFDEAAIRALKPDQLTGVIRTPVATNPNQ